MKYCTGGRVRIRKRIILNMKKMLGDRLREVIADPNAPIRNLIDKKKTEEFLESPSDYGKPWYGQLMAGPQMVAFMLQVNYWLETYHIAVI